MRVFVIVFLLFFQCDYSVSTNPLAGTLYDRIVRVCRDRVQQIAALYPLVGEVQLYEHIDVSDDAEVRGYLKWAKLDETDLIKAFKKEFVIRSPSVDKTKFNAVLSCMVSRPLGRLELELLMTKMSVRRDFWKKIQEEVREKKVNFIRAAEQYRSTQESALDFLSSIYSVSNLLRVLINPGNPDIVSITDIMVDSNEILEKIVEQFSFSKESASQMRLFQREFEIRSGPIVRLRVADMICGTFERDIRLVVNLLNTWDVSLGTLVDKLSIVELFDNTNSFTMGTKDVRPSICIKFDDYNLLRGGIAIKGGYTCYTRKYYSKNGKNVGLRQRTIQEAVFHEIDHALHFFENRIGMECKSIDKMYEQYKEGVLFGEFMWTNDEEFLTISGLSYNDELQTWMVDPVSCASFCTEEPRPNDIRRCFHVELSDSIIDIDEDVDRIPLETSHEDYEVLEGLVTNVSVNGSTF
jgi:hypothetical protein